MLRFEYPEGGFNDMMTRHEAAAVIGIEYFPSLVHGADGSAQALTRRKLAERYKRVMLLNHPDRGGSPYLAMKINEARRVLMRYCR
jgi:DnaJ homolog subfamily C member 19